MSDGAALKASSINNILVCRAENYLNASVEMADCRPSDTPSGSSLRHFATRFNASSSIKISVREIWRDYTKFTLIFVTAMKNTTITVAK